MSYNFTLKPYTTAVNNYNIPRQAPTTPMGPGAQAAAAQKAYQDANPAVAPMGPGAQAAAAKKAYEDANPAVPTSSNPAPNPNIAYNKLPDTPVYQDFNSAPVTNNVSGIAAPKYSDWQGQNQNIYKLERQAPLTQNGQAYENQNLHDLQTGKFGDVESARNATDRANALRTSQALQASRGALARGGDMDPAALARAQDQASAGANAANLNATNSVNGMQRQYSADALTRARQIELDNQDRAVTERNNLINNDNTNYNRGIDQRNYTDFKADSLNKDAIAKGTYGDQRNDVGNNNARQDVNQHNDNKSQTYLTDLNKATYGDTKAEGLYNRQNDQYKTNTANNQWALQRQDANAATAFNQNFQTSQAADSRNRFDLQRQDTQSNTAYDRSEALRLEGKGDTLATINSISDPKAKAAAMQMYTNGTPIRDILAKIENNGTINSDYRSASPGTATYQAKIDELKSYYPNKSDAEIAQLASDERLQDRTIARTPANAATTTQNNKDALAILAKYSGDTTKISPAQKDSLVASGDIKSFSPANMPVGDSAQALAGQPVYIDGNFYKVIKGDTLRTGWNGPFGDSARHTDVTQVQDEQGNTKYIYNGQLSANPPETV